MGNKILCFEYITYKLVEWYKSFYPTITHPEFTFGKLKVMKLLFFVSAVDATTNNHFLLDILNKFYAMPYGPVESDIYKAILNKDTQYFEIKDGYTMIKNQNISNISTSLSEPLRANIDDAIEKLKQKNNNLVKLPAYVLVDITHKWDVWEDAMDIAEILNKRSEIMQTEDIIRSSKYYE